jgi:hypothetical protein
MTKFKGNNNGIMERTNKTNTSKHDLNSPSQPHNVKGKRSTLFTLLHNCKKNTTLALK